MYKRLTFREGLLTTEELVASTVAGIVLAETPAGVTGEGRPFGWPLFLESVITSSGELDGSKASLLGAGVKLELELYLTGGRFEDLTFATSDCVPCKGPLLLLSEEALAPAGLVGTFFWKKPKIEDWLLDELLFFRDEGGPAVKDLGVFLTSAML